VSFVRGAQNSSHPLTNHKDLATMHAAANVLTLSVPMVMPLMSATELCVLAHTDEHNVFVNIRLVGKTETWVRLPERRKNVSHLRLQADHLTDVAGQLSLPQFRRYLIDCGFVVMP
jgi:hypothetical protein